MTAQDLKNSILQRAMQGKLVEQRDDEGTAAELLFKIKAEKGRLIKEGKIKKEKPLPEISEDEIPFDIPDSWEWVFMGNICDILGGYAFKSSEYTDSGTRVIRISDFNENGLLYNDKKYYKYDDSLDNYLIKSFDILMCMTGGTVGKSCYLGEIDNQMYLNQRVADIRNKFLDYIDTDYLNYVVCSSYIRNIINASKTSTNDNISMSTIQNFPFPLPPLAEQKRIVAKIEELMPFVEQYGKAYDKLTQLNNKFPEDMRKSILQYAMQGKLVEQRAEEGTAEELLKQIRAEKDRLIKEGKIKKEKPLPEVTDEEKPFELPLNWEWIRLGDFIMFIGGSQPPKSDFSTDKKKGYVRLIQVRDYKSDEYIVYIPESSTKKFCDEKDIMIGRYGPPLFQILRGLKGAYNVALMKAKPIVDIDSDFLYYLLQIPNLLNVLVQKSSRSCGQDGVDMDTLKNYVVALPPLAEQHRIVEAIENLMPYCRQLSK